MYPTIEPLITVTDETAQAQAEEGVVDAVAEVTAAPEAVLETVALRGAEV